MKKLLGVMVLTIVALSISLGQTQTPEKKKRGFWSKVFGVGKK